MQPPRPERNGANDAARLLQSCAGRHASAGARRNRLKAVAVSVPNFAFFPPEYRIQRCRFAQHATLEQTKNMLLSMARGDEDRNEVMAQIYKQLAA